MKKLKSVLFAITTTAGFIACNTGDDIQYENSAVSQEALEGLPPGADVPLECTVPEPNELEKLEDVPRMEASVTTPLPHGTYIDLLVEGDLHHPTDAIDYLNYEVYIQRLTDLPT